MKQPIGKQSWSQAVKLAGDLQEEAHCTRIVAPIVGKQPVDYHIWIFPGTSPAFIREEGPLYEGGPIWRIEQISPEFRRSLRYRIPTHSE